MKPFVVDASVAIKWLVPEIHSEEASLLLDENNELRAPDLLWAESGNILWKKWRKEELTADEAERSLEELRQFPVRIFPTAPFCDTAWEIARRFDRSFYDSLYVALAINGGCPLVTADRRLYNTFKDIPSDFEIIWVADLA